jgi:hypothetical protein
LTFLQQIFIRRNIRNAGDETLIASSNLINAKEFPGWGHEFTGKKI